ncbi:MAG TPA: hypothetical protein VIV06_12350 [Candidatus Limnocylindrales bacterium]
MDDRTLRLERAASTAGPAPSSSATGSIYDLGYQGYEGPRLGRRHAIWALFVYSLRAAYGIGRSGRAKIAPIGLAILAILPAIVGVGILAFAQQSGVGSQAERINPISYDTYYNYIPTIIMLFVAAQAPELLGRDQRYRVLSLYFSRALRRLDYALAKVAAFVAAMLILVLLPQAVIFIGLVFSAKDVVAALSDNLPKLPPIVAVGVGIGALLGSIGLVISAFTPRRAYATAAIMAVFLVPQVVAQTLIQGTNLDEARYAVLLAPSYVLDGLNAFLFGHASTNREVVEAALPGALFAAVTVVATLVLGAILVRRYQGIEA